MSELDKVISSVSNQVYASHTTVSANTAELDRTSVQNRRDLDEIAPISKDNSATKAATEQPLTAEQVNKTLEALNAQLQNLSSNYLQFERDESTNRLVVYVKNTETSEVIRQIPSEDFLRIAKNIDAYLKQVNQSFALAPNSMPVGLITNEQA